MVDNADSPDQNDLFPPPIYTTKVERERLDRKVKRERFDARKARNKQIADKRNGKPVPPPGKPKGPNRTTRMLREIIFMAGELEGSNQKGKDGLLGYVRALARYEKKTYVMLLAKLLPQKIQADLDPNSLMARLLQTAAATRSVRDGQQPVIDVTPRTLPPPKL